MNDQTHNPRSSMQHLSSKVSRYEVLFELAGVINAAVDIESVAEVVAHRLKYIVDVFSWRDICLDGDPDDTEGPEPVAIVVDGYRERAVVMYTVPASLSRYEMGLWRDLSDHEIDELLAVGFFSVMMNMLTDNCDVPWESPFPPQP